ncbi:MAG: DNA primase, partial [Alicyclobacillus sp.]|nr:DNA primase [Alicyclobacillus sp.]
AGVQALTYLEARGFTRQTMAEFALGYAPAGTETLVQFLRKRGFAPAELVAAGLAVELDGRVMDRFRHRVVIPIVDGQGRVVAFGGRALADDAKPKYLNSPETAVFHKSALLFNLHKARKAIRQSRTAVLMEGYMDVLTAWQAGVHNAVASMGTSLTEQHARLLRRYTDRVVLAYDGDAAGREAAKRALAVLADSGLTVRVAQFPEGVDPDDWTRQHGPAALQERLQQACTEVQFLLTDVRRTANLQGEAGRQDFLRQALAVLAARATPVERESELRRLSQEFHLSLESLQDELRLVAKANRGGQRAIPREHRTQRFAVRLPPPPVKGYVVAGNRLLQAILADTRSCTFLLEQGVDELALPEQTALLALAYHFKCEHPEQGAAAFLDWLDDPQLLQLASAVLVEDPPPYDPVELAAYVRTVRLH